LEGERREGEGKKRENYNTIRTKHFFLFYISENIFEVRRLE
jgi:hypothetical protein